MCLERQQMLIVELLKTQSHIHTQLGRFAMCENFGVLVPMN